MPDFEISQLPPFQAGLLATDDVFPFTDTSASETKKIGAEKLFEDGVKLLPIASIPLDKIDFSSAVNVIDGDALKDGTVGGIKLEDDATLRLGAPLPAGEYRGQLGLDTSTDVLKRWDGGAWQDFYAGKGVNELAADNSAPNVQLAVSMAGTKATIAASLKPATAGGLFLAGPTGGAGNISQRPILGTDLPVATATTKGAVVVDGGGLVMSGDKVVIDNTVTPSTAPQLVEYTAEGLVTGGRVLDATDIPLATPSSPGAVYPGLSLTVSGTGELNHANFVAAGTATKVTYDLHGHVTGGSQLVAADIPGLPASKLISGTLDPARIAPKSITSSQLDDYALSYIQEAQPPTTGVPIGELWFKESAAQLHMWNGNSWMPVGFGRLSEENLRFCGTFDANANTVELLTPFGISAGFAVGTLIPSATDALTGAYLVVTTPGVFENTGYDNGDWVLCLGTARGWVRVDTLSAAGGIGNARLDDLLDVDASAPLEGDAILFDAVTATWISKPLPIATDAANGIVQLADAAAITAGTAGRVVTADQLKTTNDGLAAAVAGGLTTLTGTAPVVVTGTGNARNLALDLALLATLP